MSGETKTCTECLAEVPAGAKKCQHCGSSLAKFSVGQIAIAGIILVLAIVLAILIMDSGPNSPKNLGL